MTEIRKTFNIASEDIIIDSFMERYHFDGKDRKMIDALCILLPELIEAEAVISLGKKKAVCIVTLGKRYDELSGLAADAGHLLLSYSLECFSMEILSKAYERINECVFLKTGKWLSGYRFPGDSIEELEACLNTFEYVPVTWENGMLHPLKSVVYIAEYKDKREDAGCRSCEQCKNVTCSFRQTEKQKNELAENADTKTMQRKVYSYGISQILGDAKI